MQKIYKVKDTEFKFRCVYCGKVLIRDKPSWPETTGEEWEPLQDITKDDICGNCGAKFEINYHPIVKRIIVSIIFTISPLEASDDK